MDVYRCKLFLVLICILDASCEVFVVHPENATVMEGENVTLRCISDEKVDVCRWYRGQGFQVDIKGRYKYVETDRNDKYTNDCSIIIMGFSVIDANQWQCTVEKYIFLDSYFTKKYKITSNKAYLTIVKSLTTGKTTTKSSRTLEKTTVVGHPQNATVLKGATVVLQCKISEVISKCVWYHNGLLIIIKDRYRYCNSRGNEENTNDCSIEIHKFQNIDASYWFCTYVPDSTSENVTCISNTAYLTMDHSITTTKAPLKTSYNISNDANDASSFLECSNIILSIILSTMSILIVLGGATFYCYRGCHADGNKADFCLKSTTSTTPQSPTHQELHEYTYISIFQDKPEETSMGYLVPKDGASKGTEVKIEPIYQNNEEVSKIIT